jgi:hypothetical protein
MRLWLIARIALGIFLLPLPWTFAGGPDVPMPSRIMVPSCFCFNDSARGDTLEVGREVAFFKRKVLALYAFQGGLLPVSRPHHPGH